VNRNPTANDAPLPPQLRGRLADYLAHHLSNFQWLWGWERWEAVLAQPPGHPQRAFCCDVLQRMVGLSYWEHLKEGWAQAVDPETRESLRIKKVCGVGGLGVYVVLRVVDCWQYFSSSGGLMLLHARASSCRHPLPPAPSIRHQPSSSYLMSGSLCWGPNPRSPHYPAQSPPASSSSSSSSSKKERTQRCRSSSNLRQSR